MRAVDPDVDNGRSDLVHQSEVQVFNHHCPAGFRSLLLLMSAASVSSCDDTPDLLSEALADACRRAEFPAYQTAPSGQSLLKLAMATVKYYHLSRGTQI